MILFLGYAFNTHSFCVQPKTRNRSDNKRRKSKDEDSLLYLYILDNIHMFNGILL